MTNKTRIRVARIIAGTVIAAGASLTAAGVASAEDCGFLGLECTTPSPDPDPTADPTPPEEPTVIPTDPTEEPTEPTEEPTEPTEDPTQPTDEPTADPTDDSGNNGNGNGNGNGNSNGNGNGGGNSNTDPDGGTSAQEEGTSALTDTGSDTSAQGSGEELAETGAGQTTFLVIGAATMIAGGVGFRVLPRLMGGRGGAAA